jgi:DNA-binding MarR family transcriptional regulator
MSQVLSEQAIETQAFGALVRAYMSATKQLNAQLVADHGLTLSDYGVLLQLAWAPDRRLRRVDLADRVLLTASGITRLLDGLEKNGLVERATCDTDRRVVYAVLTDRGHTKLREAAGSHIEQIRSLFGQRLDDDEHLMLISLLARLGESEAEAECGPPDEA